MSITAENLPTATTESTRSPDSANAAVLLEGGYSIDRLQLTERAMPTLKPNEVLVRVEAVSLNFRDLDIVRDRYPIGTIPLPLIPTSDASGVVVKVGSAVSRFQPGDRVTNTFFQGWISGRVPPADAVVLGGPGAGTLQRFVAFAESGIVHTPAHLTSVEASTLPIAGLTAWESLMNVGELKPGETVVVQGTGGVSIFALQIAKAAGARVIVTSSSDEKLERARQLGADATINYRRSPNWSDAVLAATSGQGAEHIIEIGGADTFEQSLTAARCGGNVYVIGYLSGTEGRVNPLGILKRKLHVHGISVGSRDTFEEMNRAIAAWKLKPVVDRTFALADVQTAFRYLESGKHFGKVVITL